MKRVSAFSSALSLVLFISWACAHERVKPIVAQQGEVTAGKALYETHCMQCHGPTLEGTELGVDIKGRLHKRDDAFLAQRILKGFVQMQGFEETLSDENIRDVIAYINSHRSGER